MFASRILFFMASVPETTIKMSLRAISTPSDGRAYCHLSAAVTTEFQTGFRFLLETYYCFGASVFFPTLK